MEEKRNQILYVEDDDVDQMAFERFAEEGGIPYDYHIADSITKACDILESQQFDCVVLDFWLDDGTAFDLFEKINDTPIIIVTSAGNEEIAVSAMKAGAYDYLIKDADCNYLKVLPRAVKMAICKKKGGDELERYRKELTKMAKKLSAQLKNEIDEHKHAEKLLKKAKKEFEEKIKHELRNFQ